MMIGRGDTGEAKGLCIDGTNAFMADWTNPFNILDFSDPVSPVSVETVTHGGVSYDVVTADGYAFIANGAGGLLIVDVDPLGAVHLLYLVDQVALDGDRLLTGPEATMNGLREARRAAARALTPEALDADAFQAFMETELFDRETARKFRENILAAGGSEDPMVLYKRFRGAEPKIDALLDRRGLH